jgi:hypothetical protein
MKALILILLLLCAASVSVVNCQTVSGSRKDSQNQRAESTVDNARSSQLAQEIATIFFSFNDQRAKSWALSQLADVLWTHDENSARQFMQQALDTCSLSSSQGKSEREVLLSRRKTLISIISNHDAAWAERLIEDDRDLTDLERQDVNLATAYKLLESSFEKSGGFIERARKPGLPDDLPFYLQALRSKSGSAADALFVSALSQLAAQPFVPAEVILSYGTYVFSAAGKGPYSISVKAVGNSMVYDISANRDGISPELTKLYLSTAAVLLARNLQTVDPLQIGLNYYTSRLLLEKAQQVAPDLVSAFRSNLAANANRVSDVYATDPPKREAVPTSSTNGSNADADEGEDALLATFFSQWLQKDYVAAQKILDKVSAVGLHDDLQQVLSFRQIADDLEKGVSPTKVKSSILKLPRNMESALLWCGLANVYVQQAKSNAAKESLVAAVNVASHIKDYRGPYLLLNVAKIYAAFNPPMAALTFKEAVRQFNALEGDPPPTISWQRKVQATLLSRDFSLQLKGLTGHVADVVSELAGEEDSDVYPVLLTLKDERLKARSLISYLKFMLSKPTPKM